MFAISDGVQIALFALAGTIVTAGFGFIGVVVSTTRKHVGVSNGNGTIAQMVEHVLIMLGEHDSRMVGLEAKTDNLHDCVDKVEAKVDGITTDISEIRSRVDGLEQPLTDVAAKVSRLWSASESGRKGEIDRRCE